MKQGSTTSLLLFGIYSFHEQTYYMIAAVLFLILKSDRINFVIEQAINQSFPFFKQLALIVGLIHTYGQVKLDLWE